MLDVYERIEQMKTGNFAEKVAADIWNDVTGRAGWRQSADLFDDHIKHAILNSWITIVFDNLTNSLGLTDCPNEE